MKKSKYLWKLLSITMVAILSVGFTSCSDDDDPSEVNVNPSTVMFDATGGTVSVMVSSNTSWTISGAPLWLQVSTISGKNNQTVTLTASSNSTQDTRSGMLNIVTTDGDASAVVSFTQPGTKIDENEVINTIWEDDHHFADGSTYTLSLKFGTTTATLSETTTSGSLSLTDATNYTFTRTNNIVVLRPVEAGNAVMEGKIESGAKMILTNTSNGETYPRPLYKK